MKIIYSELAVQRLNNDPIFWSTREAMNPLLRTQNCAEAWHNRINLLVNKPKSGFYYLSNYLMNELKYSLSEIEKKLNGVPIQHYNCQNNKTR